MIVRAHPPAVVPPVGGYHLSLKAVNRMSKLDRLLSVGTGRQQRFLICNDPSRSQRLAPGAQTSWLTTMRRPNLALLRVRELLSRVRSVGFPTRSTV